VAKGSNKGIIKDKSFQSGSQYYFPVFFQVATGRFYAGHIVAHCCLDGFLIVGD
jgi:hypothetical protein